VRVKRGFNSPSTRPSRWINPENRMGLLVGEVIGDVMVMMTVMIPNNTVKIV
jgi:hypothetical protein